MSSKRWTLLVCALVALSSGRRLVVNDDGGVSQAVDGLLFLAAVVTMAITVWRPHWLDDPED